MNPGHDWGGLHGDPPWGPHGATHSLLTGPSARYTQPSDPEWKADSELTRPWAATFSRVCAPQNEDF